jgi:hypothetical protein
MTGTHIKKHRNAGRRMLAIAAQFPIAVLSVTIGCGGSDVATVKGIAKLDGTPLEGGSVTFFPEASGPLAYSAIATDGSYELRSGSFAGLKPGEYVATVSHPRGRPSARMTMAQIEALELVPVRYTSKTTSDLHREVAPGSNQIDLELTSPP